MSDGCWPSLHHNPQMGLIFHVYKNLTVIEEGEDEEPKLNTSILMYRDKAPYTLHEKIQYPDIACDYSSFAIDMRSDQDQKDAKFTIIALSKGFGEWDFIDYNLKIDMDENSKITFKVKEEEDQEYERIQRSFIVSNELCVVFGPKTVWIDRLSIYKDPIYQKTWKQILSVEVCGLSTFGIT